MATLKDLFSVVWDAGNCYRVKGHNCASANTVALVCQSLLQDIGENDDVGIREWLVKVQSSPRVAGLFLTGLSTLLISDYNSLESRFKKLITGLLHEHEQLFELPGLEDAKKPPKRKAAKPKSILPNDATAALEDVQSLSPESVVSQLKLDMNQNAKLTQDMSWLINPEMFLESVEKVDQILQSSLLSSESKAGDELVVDEPIDESFFMPQSPPRTFSPLTQTRLTPTKTVHMREAATPMRQLTPVHANEPPAFMKQKRHKTLFKMDAPFVDKSITIPDTTTALFNAALPSSLIDRPQMCNPLFWKFAVDALTTDESKLLQTYIDREKYAVTTSRDPTAHAPANFSPATRHDYESFREASVLHDTHADEALDSPDAVPDDITIVDTGSLSRLSSIRQQTPDFLPPPMADSGSEPAGAEMAQRDSVLLDKRASQLGDWITKILGAKGRRIAWESILPPDAKRWQAAVCFVSLLQLLANNRISAKQLKPFEAIELGPAITPADTNEENACMNNKRIGGVLSVEAKRLKAAEWDAGNKKLEAEYR